MISVRIHHIEAIRNCPTGHRYRISTLQTIERQPHHLMTVAWVELKPGSPMMFVETFCMERDTEAPVESTPVRVMPRRSGGSCPIWLVEGVKPIAIAACPGGVPPSPTPPPTLPTSHGTGPVFSLN